METLFDGAVSVAWKFIIGEGWRPELSIFAKSPKTKERKYEIKYWSSVYPVNVCSIASASVIENVWTGCGEDPDPN